MQVMSEVIRGYTIGPLDRYFFFHDFLIVLSASRPHAVAVSPDGEMEGIPIWYAGEQRGGVSMGIDKASAPVK